jgi:NodT family efflux transporter outer membrane factor (OMF) lipoprotein
MPWRPFLFSLLLTGCMPSQNKGPPIMDIPTDWNSEATIGMQDCPIDGFIWWQSLNDPLLDSLIERGRLQNLDLYMAAMRILQAREVLNGGKANYLPHVDGAVSYDYARYNQQTLGRILDLHHSDRQTRQFSLFEIGFDAEWEIDLFGLNASKIKALQNQAMASEEDFRQIELTLSAEVAKNYVELRGSQFKLQLIEKLIELQNESSSLISGLAYAGFIGNIEEIKNQEELNLLLAKKPEIELLIKKAIHRISVLLGYSPEMLYAELALIQPLPELPYQKPIGIPSELLRQRPDIRKAEKELAASLALVDSAIAELFPRLTLKGFIGDLSALGSNSLTVFAGPQLFLPIFNSKMLNQSVQINKMKAKEACYSYQKTVLEALEEVENALSAFNAEWKKGYYFAQVQRASQDTYISTFQLYQRGFKDYRDVLEAHKNLLDSQNTYMQSHLDLLLRYIALYKSLGGGWVDEWCQET